MFSGAKRYLDVSNIAILLKGLHTAFISPFANRSIYDSNLGASREVSCVVKESETVQLPSTIKSQARAILENLIIKMGSTLQIQIVRLWNRHI